MRKFLLLLLIAVPAAAQSTSGAGFPPYACSANYLNQSYRDTDNNLSYKCASIPNIGYLWQPVNPSIFPVVSAPAGSCTNGLPSQQVISTGVLYSCQSGTWGVASGGAGGAGTVNSAIQGQPAIYPGNGTAVGGITNGLFYCDAFASLTACATAANVYVGTNETGSGKAATMILSDGTYSTGGTPTALNSGITVRGVMPRTEANSSNPDLQAVPNGGTWIDCGNAPCFTATAVAAGYRDINFSNVGFKNWGTTAGNAFFTAGTTTSWGLGLGYLEHIRAIGNTTGGSDLGILLYNSQHVSMDDVKIWNVNTGLSFQGTGSNTFGVGGNSEITGLYVATCPKSVANGNSTKPGIFLGTSSGTVSINLVTLIRPQVNTFNGSCAGLGNNDGTAHGIDLTTISSVTMIGADIEGSYAVGLNLTGVASARINTALVNGTTSIAVDSTSAKIILEPTDIATTLNIDAAAAPYVQVFGTSNGTFGGATPFGYYNANTSNGPNLTGFNFSATGTTHNFGSSINQATVNINAPGNTSTYPVLNFVGFSGGGWTSHLLYDYNGSFSTSTNGTAGYGWFMYGGFTGRDAVFFGNGANKAYGGFIPTSYSNATLGTFAVTHDFLMGGGIGFWNGTNKAKFDFPTVTAARDWTLPDASGQVGIIPTASTGHAICETTAHTLGHCSTAVASDGTCTCS